MIGRFAFDGGSRRMVITDRDDENDDYEFHCGDCFKIEVDGVWHDARIEHSCTLSPENGWYLIGLPKHFQLPALSYVGLRAKI